jgi:hypothetical protein
MLRVAEVRDDIRSTPRTSARGVGVGQVDRTAHGHGWLGFFF